MWYEGTGLMEVDSRIRRDERRYMCLLVCALFVSREKINAPQTDFPEAFSSLINLSLNVTSKNCSSVGSFLPSLHLCTHT